MPILQYALLRGLEHVTRVTVNGLFQFMNWPTSTSDDQCIGKLLEAFGSELGMTLYERAMCFQRCHKLTARALHRAATIATHAASRGLRQVVVDTTDFRVERADLEPEAVQDSFLGPIKNMADDVVALNTKLATPPIPFRIQILGSAVSQKKHFRVGVGWGQLSSNACTQIHYGGDERNNHIEAIVEFGIGFTEYHHSGTIVASKTQSATCASC